MHNFFEFIEYHSTCFGRSVRPSSGVQDCTHSISNMSYIFVNCLLGGTLASSQLTCMTYTWSCIYSHGLLMMDGETVRNMYS